MNEWNNEWSNECSQKCTIACCYKVFVSCFLVCFFTTGIFVTHLRRQNISPNCLSLAFVCFGSIQANSQFITLQLISMQLNSFQLISAHFICFSVCLRPQVFPSIVFLWLLFFVWFFLIFLQLWWMRLMYPHAR